MIYSPVDCLAFLCAANDFNRRRWHGQLVIYADCVNQGVNWYVWTHYGVSYTHMVYSAARRCELYTHGLQYSTTVWAIHSWSTVQHYGVSYTLMVHSAALRCELYTHGLQCSTTVWAIHSWSTVQHYGVSYTHMVHSAACTGDREIYWQIIILYVQMLLLDFAEAIFMAIIRFFLYPRKYLPKLRSNYPIYPEVLVDTDQLHMLDWAHKVLTFPSGKLQVW